MPQPRFELSEHDLGGEVRLAVRGDLDLATTDALTHRLAGLAGAGRRTLLDLRDVTFMDSSGLRALMLAREQMIERDWDLRIVPPAGEARQVLRISGVESYLPLVDP